MRNIIIPMFCMLFFAFMPKIVLANQDTLNQKIQDLQILIKEMRREYDAKINKLENKIAKLEGEKTKTENEVVLEKEIELLLDEEEEQPIISYVSKGTGGGMWQMLLPDISVIGDTLGNITWPEKSIDEGRAGSPFAENEFADRLSLREIELGLMGVLDPYARADFFLTSEDGGDISIEEGYMTLLTLPWGLQTKAGIFRTSFGKMNRTHRPEIHQIDYPKPIKNFLGEEGQKEPGISISKLIPNPWNIYSELTAEILTPSDEGVKGKDQIYLAHLRNYLDITESSSIELGLSFQTRDISDTDDTTLTKRNFRQTMEGVDLTFRWRPPGKKLYKSFFWQTEFFATQRETGSFDDAGNTVDVKDINSLGFYTFGEYQLTRRLFTGLRFDYSQFPTNDKDSEWSVSPYLTFWQSEFTRLRLEYTHSERNSITIPVEEGDNSLTLQATFTLGAHRPHPF
ncbi:MAG: hypothetical protein SCARUB_03317 [Candidatus Scalindua rubra]|uniref:Uncharacterized protein n=1 Tax=Candidatus Scalindua rubra TaxID=1872076 RepID=A0A1E3X7F4_9BACT|nr:MAG: hypothetical protein SCARUB_03317 [Candidatus Scalindua rubra]